MCDIIADRISTAQATRRQRALVDTPAMVKFALCIKGLGQTEAKGAGVGVGWQFGRIQGHVKDTCAIS